MIEQLRKDIDTIDEQILHLMQKRIALMKQIGKEKKKEGKPIRDTDREEKKLLQLEDSAKLLDIPVILVKNMWKLFFEISEEVEK